MRFLKSFRAAEVVEDPSVTARREGIAARTRTETSLYAAVQKAQESHEPSRNTRLAKELGQ